MSNDVFNKAMYFVEISEGGTNNDPDDRGGLTNHGISEKQYPNIDIENLSADSARQIYYNDYWLKNKCNLMREQLAIFMFDSSVNCGAESAARWLQKTLNMKGAELEVDDIIGTVTITAANMYNPMTLVSGVAAYRLDRYCNLLKKDHKQYKFVRGWIDRVSRLLFYII